MLFRGYIDESYSKQIFTLSCLMTTPHEWMWFESAWKRVLREKNKELRRAGRTQISRYHAADCSSCKDEFEGWSEDEQIAFVKKLLMIFEQRFTNSVAYSIPIADWKVVFPEHAADVMEQMYGTLVKFLMVEFSAQVRDAARRHAVKPIQVAMFHERSQYDSTVHNAFNQMLNDDGFSGKHPFSSITTTGWEDSIPLQAADLIAYEAFKDSSNHLAGRPRSKSLEALLKGKGFGGRARLFDVGGIQKLRSALEAIQTK